MKRFAVVTLGALVMATATPGATSAARADGIGIYVGPLSLGIGIHDHGGRYCRYHDCDRGYGYRDDWRWHDRDDRRWHDRDGRRWRDRDGHGDRDWR